MAKTGGFSKADVAIMFESNAQAVAKGFDQLNTQFLEMNQLLRASVTATKKQTDAMSKLYKQQTKVEKSTKGMVTHLRDWMIVIGQARAAFLNLKMVTTDIYGSILGVSSQFERLRKLMEGLSKQTEPVARLQEVNEKMEYLLNLSKNAPFAISELQNAFIKFDTVGLQPANGSLNALVDAVAAFGGSGQELERAGVAIQQMMGKGVVSMEELRQQLGEAVPTAMKAMADAAGMSVGQLTNLISKGVVESKSAIALMLGEFSRLYGGAAQSMMETASGLISKLRTEFTLFVNEAAEKSGLIDNIKERIKSLIEFLDSPEALEAGKSIAATLNVILNAMSPLIGLIASLGKEIAWIFNIIVTKNLFLKIASGFKLVEATAGGVVVSKGLKGFLSYIKETYKSGKEVTTLMGVEYSAAANVFATSTAIIKKALTGLWTVVAANPIGVLITAISGLIVAWEAWTIKTEKQRAAVEQLNKELKEMNQLIEAGKPGISEYNKSTYETAKDELDNVTEQLESNLIKINGLQNRIKALGAIGINDTKGYQELWQLQKENDELKARIPLLQQMIDLQREQKAIEASKNTKYYKDIVEDVNKSRDALKAWYAEQSQAIDKEEDSIERARKRSALLDEYNLKLYDIKVSILEAQDAIANSNLPEKLRNNLVIAIGNLFTTVVEETNIALDKIDFRIIESRTKLEAIQKTFVSTYTKMLAASEKNKFIADTPDMRRIYKAQAEEQARVIVENAKKAGKNEAEIYEILTKETEKLTGRLAKLNEERQKSAFNSKLQAKAEDKIIETATNYATQLELSQKLQAEGVDLTSAEVALYGQLYAKTAKLTEAKREELKATIEKTVAVKEHTEGLIALDKMTNEIEQGWANLQASKTDNLDDYLKLVVSNAKKELHYDRLTAEEKLRADKLILEQRALEEANWWDKHKTALQGTMEEWSNFGRQIDDVWNTTFENLSDALYDFTQTGEFNFKNFANTIIQELTKIGIKAMLAESAMALLGTGGDSKNTLWGGLFSLAQTGLSLYGSFGSSGNLSTGVGDTVDVGNLQSSLGKGDIITKNDLDKIGGWIAVKAHTGGIIGASNLSQHLVSPEMFANATKYHDGGITGLKSDEVPAILQKGEGVFTKEQMKAMGNSKANVTVNVINNTQEQVTAQQSQPRFDGEKMILDVVLKNMNQPGSFRDGMTGAMR